MNHEQKAADKYPEGSAGYLDKRAAYIEGLKEREAPQGVEDAAKDQILFNELLLKYPRPSTTDENTRLLNQYKDYSWDIHHVYELLDREVITPSKAREFTRSIMDKAGQLPGVEECIKKAKEQNFIWQDNLKERHFVFRSDELTELINFSQGKTAVPVEAAYQRTLEKIEENKDVFIRLKDK